MFQLSTVYEISVGSMYSSIQHHPLSFKSITVSCFSFLDNHVLCIVPLNFRLYLEFITFIEMKAGS